MDVAIVTGASSALGEAISRKLVESGFRVYGLGGDYRACKFKNVDFRPTACDLGNLESVETVVSEILEREGRVTALVNNAKFYGRAGFFELSVRELEQILRINLLSPLLMAQMLAESLGKSQGAIVQIGPLNVEQARGGPAGAAASGGLKWMSGTLFKELRDYGVKVTQIAPEPNLTKRNSDAGDDRRETVIDPEAVAEAVCQVVNSQYGNIATEIVLRPQRTELLEIERIRRLPYPDPQPVPYTVPREVIEAEERLEEEEFAKALSERKARRKANREKKAQDNRDSSERTPEDSPGEDAPELNTVAEPNLEAPKESSTKPASPPNAEPLFKEIVPSTGKRTETGFGQKTRRKSRPASKVVGFLDGVPSLKGSAVSPDKPQAEPKPQTEPVRPEEQAKDIHETPQIQDAPALEEEGTADPPAKKAAKKAAKKTPQKAAKKAARKVAKKSPAKKASKKAAKKAPRKAAKKAVKTAKSDQKED